MAIFNLQINGKQYKADVSPDTPVLWVLRDNLGLVGTKFGCGLAQCGACTIHYNGVAVRSCMLPVSSVKDAKITTIEGLSANGDHPLQEAWNEVDVPQCGVLPGRPDYDRRCLTKAKATPYRRRNYKHHE